MIPVRLSHAACAAALAAAALLGATPMSAAPQPKSPLDFKMKDIDGKEVDLSQYKGKVVMIVNVASKCGNTPQYATLQKLYTQYKDRGFVVLGFPANEFGMQEPGSNGEIKEFCNARYKVTFPMFSKIVVKGEGQDPMYRFLTDKTTDPAFAGDIEWNFAKFLLNRKGEVVARIKAFTDPGKPEVVSLIEKELGAAGTVNAN